MRPRPPTSSRRSRAFTLVELLAVLAIIALLLALLLPSITRARRQALNVLCLSQLRQIGAGWTNYLIESRGHFPFAATSLNLHWFYGGREPSIASVGMPNYVYKDRLLNPYLAARTRNQARAEIFRCPLDDAIGSRPLNASPTGWATCYDYFGNSYMMNFNLLAYWEFTPSLRMSPVVLSMVQFPHSQVLLAGDCQWYYAANGSFYSADFHHQSPYVNLVFLDGHASRTPIAPLQDFTPDYSISIRYPASP